MAQPAPVRIAHAYGNTRDGLQRALNADVDMIEVDIWFRADDVFAHHARRLNPLPVMADKESPAHRFPRHALPIWPRYRAWLQLNPPTLGEILATVKGRKRLLLDVKGRQRGGRSADFAATIARKVREHEASAWVTVCGQVYPPLNALRSLAPEIEVRYSLEKPYQWESFLRKMGKDPAVRQVCISHRFIDDEKARVLEENGVNAYTWTIDDPEMARHWVEEGIDGIISNNLELLESLPRR
jgi:glycerophosphoryl diester phosphodiesterase